MRRAPLSSGDSFYVAVLKLYWLIPCFTPPLELPNIQTPIFASINSTAKTLPIKPLPTIHVTSVKPINPKPVSQTLLILPSISTPFGPSLNPIPIIFTIYPIILVSPTHIIVICTTPRAFSLIKLTLKHITVGIYFDPRARVWPLFYLGVWPNWPNNWRVWIWGIFSWIKDPGEVERDY